MSHDKQKIGAKPAGLAGSCAGLIMNLLHEKQYKSMINRYVLAHLDQRSDVKMLDIGCGGGKALQLFAVFCPHARLFGLDLSSEMTQSVKS